MYTKPEMAICEVKGGSAVQSPRHFSVGQNPTRVERFVFLASIGIPRALLCAIQSYFYLLILRLSFAHT
jgi:hypothetical protein